MAETEASGDADDSGSVLKQPDDDLRDDPDDSFWSDDPGQGEDGGSDGHFDAFNSNTWSFTPAPTPWYRSKQAVAVLIAATTAAIAIVVSGVLLVFRSPGNDPADEPASVVPTALTSASRVPVASSELPPPPPPPLPPPPPPPAAEPMNPAPDGSYRPPPPRSTKQPEIGVTRTPATRSPISVAPQPRSPRN